MDIITYALSKKYTENTAIALGAVKGAPCQLEKAEKVDGGTELTFKWVGDDKETVQRRTVFVADGVGVEDIKIEDEHLFFYLTDGRKIDAGELISGIKTGIWIGSTMPPSDDYVLWIDPNDPGDSLEAATKEDIDKLWGENNG